MTEQERLQVFEKVNQTESLEELSRVILELANKQGLIKGRTGFFNADLMARHCRNFMNFEPSTYRFLTREFGIRAQAMLLRSYYDKE